MSAVLEPCEWGNVLPIDAQIFYQTAVDLQMMRTIVERAGGDLSGLMTPDDHNSIGLVVGKLAEEVQKFGCRVTLASANRLTAGSEAGVLTYQATVALINEIDGRLRDELGGRMSFSLNDIEASYFFLQRPLMADPNYEARFPSVIYDLEESGKCWALERYTASAFHMVRALETALLAVSRCAGIEEPTKPYDRTWGPLLTQLEAQMKAKWPNVADRQKGDGLFFEDLYVTLDALKNPVRNATAHPRHQFTMVESYDMLRNGGSLLRKINTRCDERGMPKARKR